MYPKEVRQIATARSLESLFMLMTWMAVIAFWLAAAFQTAAFKIESDLPWRFYVTGMVVGAILWVVMRIVQARQEWSSHERRIELREIAKEFPTATAQRAEFRQLVWGLFLWSPLTWPLGIVVSIANLYVRMVGGNRYISVLVTLTLGVIVGHALYHEHWYQDLLWGAGGAVLGFLIAEGARRKILS